MKIYILETDIDNYKGCYIKNEETDRKILRQFNKGIEISIPSDFQLEYDRDSNNPAGDICECYDCRGFFINKKFMAVLSDISQINIRFVPLNDDFVLLNNLTVLDCLDRKKTKYKYFENDILGVEQYYFKENNYPPLFQVKLQNQLIIRDYFVTDEFIDIVKKNNIKGLKFKEIWGNLRQRKGLIMTKITGTNTYIDVELDDRIVRILGEMIVGGFVCYKSSMKNWLVPESEPLTEEDKKEIIQKVTKKTAGSHMVITFE